MKDHYKTLRVSSKASLQEIKKAYRKLAMEYHPDKNSGAFAATLFQDTQTAYQILSNHHTRKQYDESRLLHGYKTQKHPPKNGTDGLLQQSIALNKKVENIATADINQLLLYDYLCWLLSDEHLAILQHEQETITKDNFIKQLIPVIKKLDYRYFILLYPRLISISGKQTSHHLQESLALKTRAYYFRKWQPIGIVCMVIALCLLMYVLYKK